MGVRVRLREVAANGRLKMWTIPVEKLPGPQFDLRLWEVSAYGRCLLAEVRL